MFVEAKVDQVTDTCLVCGSPDSWVDRATTHYLNLSEPLMVKICPNCQFRWLYPQPSAEDYEALYQTGYLGASKTRESEGRLLQEYKPIDEGYENETVPLRTKWFELRLKRLKHQFPEAKTILDIGAGTGDFLALAKQYGFIVAGTEVSKFACDRAKEKHNLDIICDDIENFLENHQKTYDIIHLSHTFEHLLNPHVFLKEVQRLLNPSGALIIEVPNQFRSWIDSLQQWRTGVKQVVRSTFSVHHPYFYGADHVNRLLVESGFSDVRVTTFLPERLWTNPKEFLVGCIDCIGNLCGGHGRNVEAIAIKSSRAS